MNLRISKNYICQKLFKTFKLCLLDALQIGASQFEQSSGQLKRKMAWKNIKVNKSF